MKIIQTMLKTFALFLVCVPSFSQESNLLSLVSPHFPPYTYKKNNEIVGIGPDIIKRVFSNTNIPYKITMIEDYSKAVHAIKLKLSDGMFLASQNAERDAIATFTQPLIINKWSWFMLKDSKVDFKSNTFKLQSKIGTLKGTNTYKWLKTNGYNIIASPIDASYLVTMLKLHRIDAAFLAEAVFEHQIDEQELSLFKKVIEVEKKFGLYISHDYLKKYPGTLEQINHSIEKVTY